MKSKSVKECSLIDRKEYPVVWIFENKIPIKVDIPLQTGFGEINLKTYKQF